MTHQNFRVIPGLLVPDAIGEVNRSYHGAALKIEQLVFKVAPDDNHGFRSVAAIAARMEAVRTADRNR